MQPSNPSPLALNAPTVPAAVVNGGLRWQDLNDPGSPVHVQIVLTPGTILLHHRIDLYWQGDFITTVQVNEDHLKTGIVSLSVPPADILRFPDGDHAFYYIATAPIGGGAEPSPDGVVKVKRTVPGDPDPDNTTPYVNENLTPPEGVPDEIDTATDLPLTVAPWLLMHEGDVLTLYWGGTQHALKQPPLTPGQVNQPQTVTVPAQTLIDAGDSSNLQVNYDIRDTVNNWSLWSLPTFTDVQVDPLAPAAPRVVDADSNLVIDLDRLGSKDVRVDVPAYTGIALDDGVTLRWEGQTSEGAPVVPNLPQQFVDNLGFGPVFDVPNKSVVDIGGGSARVFYIVAPQAGGASRRSRSVTVTVSGQPATLARPDVREAVGNSLDPANVLVDAHVIIAPYVGKGFGDVVYLTWNGKAFDGTDYNYSAEYPVGRNEETRDIEFLVPKQYLTPLANGSLLLTYQVKFVSGTTQPSLPSNYNVVGSAPLPMPTVDNAPGDILDPDVYDRTVVHIDGVGARLKASDEVVAYWTGDSLPGSSRQDFLVSSDGQMLSWNILPPLVEVNRNATVAVRYAVTRAATGGQENSEVRTLQIRSTLIATLPAPTFPHATLFGYLDCCSVPRIWEGITVSIEGNSNFSAGDRIELTWQGCDSLNGTSPIPGAKATFYKTLTATDAVNGFQMVVLPYESLIEPMVNNGSGTARYQLYKGGALVAQSEMDFVKINRTWPSGEVCTPLNDICEK